MCVKYCKSLGRFAKRHYLCHRVSRKSTFCLYARILVIPPDSPQLYYQPQIINTMGKVKEQIVLMVNIADHPVPTPVIIGYEDIWPTDVLH